MAELLGKPEQPAVAGEERERKRYCYCMGGDPTFLLKIVYGFSDRIWTRYDEMRAYDSRRHEVLDIPCRTDEALLAKCLGLYPEVEGAKIQAIMLAPCPMYSWLPRPPAKTV
jgi:hypothetical protein